MRYTVILFFILTIAPLGELLARFNVPPLAAEKAEMCARTYEIFFIGDPPGDTRMFWFNDCLCMDKYCLQQVGGSTVWARSYFAYCIDINARSCTNCECSFSFPGSVCRYNNDGVECNVDIRVGKTVTTEERHTE